VEHPIDRRFGGALLRIPANHGVDDDTDLDEIVRQRACYRSGLICLGGSWKRLISRRVVSDAFPCNDRVGDFALREIAERGQKNELSSNVPPLRQQQPVLRLAIA